MSIELRTVEKRFGGFTAVKGVSLHIPSGELVALLGPSGSGKTTLLRILAGLEVPDGGSISIDGEDATNLHVRKRGIGFVFQHYALFRTMTVFENVAFGLRVMKRGERPPRRVITERVNTLLKLVQLENMADRYPSQLSGGQRQRVALIRALAVEPRILLLDEPFGALDARVRAELRRWLRRLHDEMSITSVFVTHDQEEALEVADRIVVMNEGRIEQVGRPDEVYERPANPFIMQFLGSVNLFHGRLHRGRAAVGGWSLEVPEFADVHDVPATVYVRSHDIVVAKSPLGGECLPASVRHVHPLGATMRVALALAGSGDLVEAIVPRETCRDLDLKSGDAVYIRPRNARFFSEDYQI